MRDTILLLITAVSILIILSIYHFGNGKNTENKYGVFPIVGFGELK